jgi:hypothetical protein
MENNLTIDPKTKRQQRIAEGLCPACGDFSYPYHYCFKCRCGQNIYRVMKKFEKDGLVEVSIVDGLKAWRWRKGYVRDELRKYSPETIAKMQLPRTNGKPMTDNIIQDAILKVLGENNIPMRESEIQRGIKLLKTIGRVIPEKENLIIEYKLIKQKKSSLPKSKRNAVEYRINFLLQRGAITEHQIKSNEND